MNKRMFVSIIAFCLITTMFIALTNVVSALPQDDYEYTTIDYVLITSDDDWIEENGVISGNGTELEPYIIEGYYIDIIPIESEGFMRAGIVIYNTNLYYIIRNCHIIDTSEEPRNEYWDDNSYGIGIYNSPNGTIENCIIERCVYGLDVYSYRLNINNNIIKECGIENEAPVEPPNGGGINTGLYLGSSSDILIKNNIFINNFQEGIVVELCENINITENNFDYNPYSIVVKSSSNCLIYLNNFMFLYETGIFTPICIEEASMDIYWDNGSFGNYWIDYNGIDGNNDGIGDTPYLNISGSINNDNYPLMTPYVWDVENGNLFDSLLVLIISLLSLVIFILILKYMINLITKAFNGGKKKR